MRLDELIISAYKGDMNELTTREVAAKLGVGVRWVQALIKSGRLPARKIGRDYVVNEKDLKFVADMKPGPKPTVSRKKSVK